ncbi:hypothetical protein H8959_008243 [Pygathrix nigripes]
MDPTALVEAIVEEVACAICMTFLSEPVSIDCGHSFCHICLSGLWEIPGESQNWGYTCPLCRAPVQPRNLRPNWQLANVVEKVHLLRLHPGMGPKGDLCERHGEKLKMFCKEDFLIIKRVHYGDTNEKHPDNPERFYRYNIVLGSQCISSGRHYWEVEVGDRSEWGLGVCKQNVDWKEVVYLYPYYGFWVIRLRKGNEYRAGTDEYPLLSLPVPPRRVGIFVDYEAHDISFYNVTDYGSHIFTFPRYPFPGRLLPYFSPCYSIGPNNTAPLAICSLDGED